MVILWVCCATSALFKNSPVILAERISSLRFFTLPVIRLSVTVSCKYSASVICNFPSGDVTGSNPDDEVVVVLLDEVLVVVEGVIVTVSVTVVITVDVSVTVDAGRVAVIVVDFVSVFVVLTVVVTSSGWQPETKSNNRVAKTPKANLAFNLLTSVFNFLS